MSNRINCQKLSSSIKAIKSKKVDFEFQIENNDNECLVSKSDLLKMIEALKKEIWPFEQEELSSEKLKEAYQKFKNVFEKSSIIKKDLISKELLIDELKEEKFAMPTEKQFLDFIVSKEEQLNELAKLGLVDPVIVPIAVDFGKDLVKDGVSKYSGLMEICAKEIRKQGHKGTLRGSDSTLFLKEQSSWNFVVDQQSPIYVSEYYKKMQFTFKEEDKDFIEGLNQEQFIQKHREAGSPFPGFAIYFKEKGNVVPRNRSENKPLSEMFAGRRFGGYSENLHKLGLTGTSAHAELTLLLLSLVKDNMITRDSGNEDDCSAIITANSFVDSTGVGNCYWSRDEGQFRFFVGNSYNSVSGINAVPMGELI